MFTILGDAGVLKEIYSLLDYTDRYYLSQVAGYSGLSLGVADPIIIFQGIHYYSDEDLINHMYVYIPGYEPGGPTNSREQPIPTDPRAICFTNRYNDDMFQRAPAKWNAKSSRIKLYSMTLEDQFSRHNVGIEEFARAVEKLSGWAPRAIELVRRYPNAFLAGGLVEKALSRDVEFSSRHAVSAEIARADSDIFITGETTEEISGTVDDILACLPEHYEISDATGREPVYMFKRLERVITVFIPGEIIIQIVVMEPGVGLVETIKKFDLAHISVAYDGSKFIMTPGAVAAIPSKTIFVEGRQGTHSAQPVKTHRLYKAQLRGYTLMIGDEYNPNAQRMEETLEDPEKLMSMVSRCYGFPWNIPAPPRLTREALDHYWRAELARYYPSNFHIITSGFAGKNYVDPCENTSDSENTSYSWHDDDDSE